MPYHGYRKQLTLVMLRPLLIANINVSIYASVRNVIVIVDQSEQLECVVTLVKHTDPRLYLYSVCM